MAKLIKVLAANTDDLSLIPRTNIVEENWLMQTVHMYTMAHVRAHTQNK